jgi:hypothetical protein
MAVKTFGTMKTNVGTQVQDTSSEFSTIIGDYLNNRYFDVLRRTNWQAVNEGYSLTLSAGDTMASLPADFGKEISVYDSTNNTEIDFISLNDLITAHPDTYEESGSVSEYTIVQGLLSDGSRYKYLKPYQIPTDTITLRIPYNIMPVAMASTGAYTVMPCEEIIELGATADAWRYKRQFAKAQDMEALYEKGIINLIWDKENQPNQIRTFNPCPYSRDTV